jgi:hypothetical protein
MGVEPVPEDIPIDVTDLPYEAQLALSIYRELPMKIAEFSGTYLGKALENLGFFFDMYEIETDERKYYFRLISALNDIQIDEAAKEKQRKEASKPKKK